MAPSGLVLIDKPAGITSHDVVARVRKLLATKKVGHAGTLDPMATGLLVLGVGSATKLLTFLVGLDKTYQATIRLGATTISDDADTEILQRADPKKLGLLTPEVISAEVAKLTGEIEQVPSAVSAIKVAGRRAYDLVRQGERVELKARRVTVSEFSIESIQRGSDFIDLMVEVSCSSGTYIRALARDLGDALGVGGYLTSLRRTRVGGFRVEDANSLTAASLSLLPLAEAARAVLPAIELSEQEVSDIRHGKRIAGGPQAFPQLAAFGPDGDLIAVLTGVQTELKSVVVFQGGPND